MTINAILSGKKLDLEFAGYSEDGFKLIDPKGGCDDVFLSTPLHLDTAFDEKRFDVFFLAKKDVLENDIFQVFDKPFHGIKSIGVFIYIIFVYFTVNIWGHMYKSTF